MTRCRKFICKVYIYIDSKPRGVVPCDLKLCCHIYQMLQILVMIFDLLMLD